LGDPRDSDNGLYAFAVPYYYVVPRERVETRAHIWIAETRRAPNDLAPVSQEEIARRYGQFLGFLKQSGRLAEPPFLSR
jgi:hypothetical protein